MKKLSDIFLKVKDFCVAHIGRKVTPLFLVMLGLSFVLWYVSKLQYSYTAEVPVVVSVEGDRHRVTCVVQGSGHNILSARYFKRKPVKLKRGDVELTPVEGEENTWEVGQESLLNAISIRNADIKVVSVSRMPYVQIDN
ncbi:MAG: hypothetical protein J6K78_06390 [Tidjanibacter sp.]|nr:hypothetical protein [Tidjanibacter sp.]